MSDEYPIDAALINDWRINYGLDTRSPADAMRWWHDNMDGKCPAGAVAALGLCINEIEHLRAELETERARLAVCGVVAMSNTPESAVAARQIQPEYRSASCDDVAQAVDREIALRAELAEARRERDEFRSALLAIFAVAEQYDTPEWNVVSDCAWFAMAAIDAARKEGP